MTDVVRKPAMFSANDPRLVMAREEEPPRAAVPMVEGSSGDLAVFSPAPPRRRSPWGGMFWSAVGGLALLAAGLAVANLVEGLFAKTPWLGAIGLALAIVAGVALLAIVLREGLGLVRLANVEHLRERALTIISNDDREQGRTLVADLVGLTARMPTLARARTRLQDHDRDIIDGRDRIRLAERELLAPLDDQARRLVVAASKRVSVVTAISPRAVVDMLFVLANALGLIRRLALLYGARPGALGVFKLFRQVISHLAVTGGVGVADSLMQQVIGHGLAAKLSARLGEGMVNGLLTARLGLLTIDQVRPLPFNALPRPMLNDLVGTLLRSSDELAKTPERPATP